MPDVSAEGLCKPVYVVGCGHSVPRLSIAGPVVFEWITLPLKGRKPQAIATVARDCTKLAVILVENPRGRSFTRLSKILFSRIPRNIRTKLQCRTSLYMIPNTVDDREKFELSFLRTFDDSGTWIAPAGLCRDRLRGETKLIGMLDTA